MLIAGHDIGGIGLGTAQFAFRDRTAEDSVATVHAALDAGVMLIDTALAYTRPGVPQVPLADSVGALGQLQQDGKIAAIGLSNVTVAQLDEALAVAPIAAVQNRLSYSDPGDLLTALACAERGVAYLAYSPFGGPAGLVPQAARAVAGRRGVSAHRVLLAWLRRQSPNIVPLAGASRPASIRDSAARLDLTGSDLETL